jgi:hypothetical protein
MGNAYLMAAVIARVQEGIHTPLLEQGTVTPVKQLISLPYPNAKVLIHYKYTHLLTRLVKGPFNRGLKYTFALSDDTRVPFIS